MYNFVLNSATDPRCRGDRVYTECGTACPATCDNKDDLLICTLQCVVGEDLTAVHIHVHVHIHDIHMYMSVCTLAMHVHVCMYMYIHKA